MPLTVNGLTVADGDPLLVGGVQAESVTVNGVEVWKNTQAPTVITDFVATDDEYGVIKLYFTPATGIPNDVVHQLVDNDTDTVLVAEVWNDYWYSVAPGVYNLRIDAVNIAGTTPSNIDVGTSLARPTGTIEFNVTGTDSWTVPEGVISVNLCMIGGGAGGRNSTLCGDCCGGGGYAGGIIEQTVEVVPGTVIPIVVGNGGQNMFDGGSPDDSSESSFDTIVAARGTQGGCGSYDGQGAERVTCYGTAHDGTTPGTRGHGGEAGFGDGGTADTTVFTVASKGAGGPGWSDRFFGREEADLYGGDGVVKISW